MRLTHTPRPLPFTKRDATAERPAHFVALSGAWPHQHRYVVAKAGREWTMRASRHVPGKGWEEYSGASYPTLRKAQAAASERADPAPVDRTSSGYTDA
jgi:hypothetical protein